MRFPSPGLRAKHATLGIIQSIHSYSVRVAISRRRYSQQEMHMLLVRIVTHSKPFIVYPLNCKCRCLHLYTRHGMRWRIKCIHFLFRRTAGLFFTANGGFLILFLFSLPLGRRGGGWWRISESPLSGISATTRRRIGRSPEKEQNFLYHLRNLLITRR